MNKQPYFRLEKGEYKFVGFHQSKLDASLSTGVLIGGPTVSANELYATVEATKAALDTIDHNHPTLNS